MSPLTETDRLAIHEIAREILREVLPTIIAAHVNACPWGRRLNKFLWMAMGAGAALGALGVTTIPSLLKLLHY